MKKVIVLCLLLAIVYFTWNYSEYKNKLQPTVSHEDSINKEAQISSNFPSTEKKETVVPDQVREEALENEDIPEPPPVETQLQRGIVNNSEDSELDSLQYVEQKLRNKERTNEELAFLQSERSFKSLPGVWAIPKNEVKDQGNVTFVTHFLSFGIVKDQGTPPDSKNALPVIFDTERGTLGVLTGKFSVKYRDKITSSNTAAQYRISTVQEFPEIKTVIFENQATSSSELISKFKSLKQDSEFLRVNLDVFESEVAPH